MLSALMEGESLPLCRPLFAVVCYGVSSQDVTLSEVGVAEGSMKRSLHFGKAPPS